LGKNGGLWVVKKINRRELRKVETIPLGVGLKTVLKGKIHCTFSAGGEGMRGENYPKEVPQLNKKIGTLCN